MSINDYQRIWGTKRSTGTCNGFFLTPKTSSSISSIKRNRSIYEFKKALLLAQD